MAIKDNREYRTFELRMDSVQEGEEKSYKVEGYASTFDEYELFEYDGIHYYERIERQAFDNCDFDDCCFLINHEGRVYARTRNGTVLINTDDHGLHHVTDLSRTTNSRELYEDIEAGNYDRMSFAFTVKHDHIVRSVEGNKVTRVIEEIDKVYDISVVDIPANASTEIGVSTRSLFDGAIKEIQAERLEAKRLETLKRLTLDRL